MILLKILDLQKVNGINTKFITQRGGGTVIKKNQSLFHLRYL